MKIKIKSFEEYLDIVKSKIDSDMVLAFLVACFSTVFTHLIFFVNNWANEDSLFNPVVESQMLGTGRWMPGNIFSEFTSPVVFMAIAAVVLGIIAVLLVKMFDLKSKLHIVIVSLLITTFPVLSMSFGYNFMIERYMAGLLLSVLAVYVTGVFKTGFVAGGVILALSLGYYQSYITVSITLVLILIILKLLDGDSIKSVGNYILKYLGMGVVGVLLYLLVVKVVYPILGVELLSYKGVNNIGSIPPLSEWLYLLKRTYGHVIFFLIGKRFYKPSLIALVAQVLLVIVSGLIVVDCVKEQKKRCAGNIVFIILLVVLFPLGMNMLDFFMYESHLSTLNIYQFVFMFILPFILLNYRKNKKNKKTNLYTALELVCVLSATIVIWSNFSLTNLYYTKMEKFNDSTVLLTNRIFARIESYPGISSDTKVFLGNREGVYDLNDSSIYDKYILFDQGLWDQYIGYTPQDGYSDYKFHAITKNLIGESYKQISSQEIEKIIESGEYEQMKMWPSNESIGFIEDVLVVKLS